MDAAGNEVHGSVTFTEFTDDADFAKWYGERMDSADMVLDTAVPSRNVTFVTCSYNRFKNERTLVFASE